MSVDVIPVILSGGGGTRLWPLSSEARPKQFHILDGDRTLLQTTAVRARELSGHPPIVVANRAHVERVLEQLAAVDVEPTCVIAEPAGRNTAPGIALAAMWLQREGQDRPMWVMPSDHRVGDARALAIAAQTAAEAAGQGLLATFGVKPHYPHTGYGYIRRGARVAGYRQLHRIDEFREKPCAAVAAAFLADGAYLWNSGMFTFTAERYLVELARHAPEVCEAAWRAFRDGRDHARLFLPSDAFADCASISIDHAVMERTRDAAVVPLDADWSDIGTWNSVWECRAKDENGNACDGDALFVRAANCLVRSHRTVSIVGLDNVVVVEGEEGLLVCHRHDSEGVKAISGALQARRAADAAEDRSRGVDLALRNGPEPHFARAAE